MLKVLSTIGLFLIGSLAHAYIIKTIVMEHPDGTQIILFGDCHESKKQLDVWSEQIQIARCNLID
jgi:hypothetical protein